MKQLLFCFILILIAACNNHNNHQKQILQDLENIKPGLGEYMATIEYHHGNLGKAINSGNYKRAAYEIDELGEVFEKVKLFHQNHKNLVKPIDSLVPDLILNPLEKLSAAILAGDSSKVKAGYNILTNNCNACHAINNMEFVKIESVVKNN
jgi:cytochrome c1